jgi:Flp pilus assembly protein TadD
MTPHGIERDFLYLLAYVYLQNARPERAAMILSALDLMQPKQHKVIACLALAQIRSEKPQAALKTLERLAMCGGIDATFHLLRAQALVALKNLDEAHSSMNIYLQLRGLKTPADLTGLS